jgi:tetratricopeptide (TPR) repeat protein
LKKNLYISFLFISFFLSAQTDKNEKLLTEAKDLIYKNPEQTVAKAKEVLNKSSNENTKVSALITMINAQMVLGQAKNVIDNCNAALKIARSEKDTVNEILLLAMLGNQYQAMMMTEEAKKYLDLAENKMNSANLPKDLFYIKGNVYNIKGIIFRGELNCEFALKYFEKAIDVYKVLPKNNINEVNQLLIEIQKGFCLISQGQPDLAQKSFLKVLNENAKIDLGYNKYFAQVGLSEILTSQKKYAESLRLLDEIPLNISDNYDPELTSMYYLSKSKNFLGLGDLQNYILFYKKYDTETGKMNSGQDEIINQTIKDFKLESEKKSTEIRLLNLSLLLVISAFLVFLTVFLIKKKFFIKQN